MIRNFCIDCSDNFLGYFKYEIYGKSYVLSKDDCYIHSTNSRMYGLPLKYRKNGGIVIKGDYYSQKDVVNEIKKCWKIYEKTMTRI